MVSTFEAHEAVTPAGSPVGVPIPVAPVVVRVILVSAVLMQSVGLLEAVPAVFVTHGRSAIMIPPMVRGFVLGVQVKPPAPVAPAVVRMPQAAPRATMLLAPVEPTSYNSVKGDGFVNVHAVKLVDAVVVFGSLEAFPKTRTAAFAVTVDSDVILLIEVADVVDQFAAVATSNGNAVLTPEKATMAPTVGLELPVAVKV